MSLCGQVNASEGKSLSVIVFAASAVETAPLPVLAGIAALGAVIVIHRVAVLNWCRATLGAGVGSLAGQPSSPSAALAGW